MLKKIITFIILMTFLLSLFYIPSSAYELEHTEANVGGYYLYNFENDLVMASENDEKLIIPSSTVKIMTACIALEASLDKSKSVTVTNEMLLGVSGRNMSLKAGDVLTVEDLLHAVICGGYNDAAHVLAFSVSNDIDSFTELMNKKARELGMTSTVYLNVTGIDVVGMTSTVRDIAILAKYMSLNEEFVKIASTKSYKLSDDATCEYSTVNNRSTLLSAYKGLSNFNTGSGDGDCAVLYYNNNGLSFITVVMNVKEYNDSDDANYAEIYSKKLLSHAINDYSVRTVLFSKNEVASLPMKYSVSVDEIGVYLEDNLDIYLSNEIDIQKDLTYTVNIQNGELTAPVSKGDTVGELIVSYDGKILAKASLIVLEDVEKNNFLYIMDIMKEYVMGRAFLISILGFVSLMLGYYIIKSNNFKKMYKKGKKK